MRWVAFFLHLVSVVELDILLAYPPVEGYPRVGKAAPRRVGLIAGLDEERVDETEEGEADGETDEGYQDPVVRHPEDKLDVCSVPAVAQVVREETPRVVLVL